MADMRRRARIDVAVFLGTSAIMFAIWAGVVRNGWVLALAFAVLAVTIPHALSMRLLDRGRLPAAIVVGAATDWGIMLLAVAIAPISLYVGGLVIVSPVVRAIPFLDRRRFALVSAGSVVASVVLVLAGRLQAGARLEEEAPEWLLDAIVVFFVPLLAVLISVDAWMNHLRADRQAAELRRSRARIVTEADRARRQIERDLHDGAQQRLVALAIQLRVAQHLVATDPDRAAALVGDLVAEAQAAVGDLRTVAHGVYPAELTQRGLHEALRSVAGRAGRPTVVRADGLPRFPADLEATAYFCCLEALQNAVKHAGEGATVTIELGGGDGLTFAVTDDGDGFVPESASGQGLVNIRDRVRALGGTLTVTSRPGAGTTVRGTLPGRPSVDPIDPADPA